MRKATFCFIAVLSAIFSFSASAQHPNHGYIKKFHRSDLRALINRIIGDGHLPTANKVTSATGERLIGTSIYFTTITDSALYKYSGSRGSLFNLNAMQFINTYPIDGRYFIGLNSITPYAMRNNMPGILSDTAEIWSADAPPFTYDHIESIYTTYDADNNILSYFSLYDQYHNYQRFINTFNTDGTLATSLNLSEPVSTWDTSQLRSLSYSGTIISDSTKQWNSAGSWSPKETNAYTFNTDGDLVRVDLNINATPMSAAEAYRYDFTYYVPHQLKTIVTTDMILNSITEVDSIGWTAGTPYYTYFQHMVYSDGALSDSQVTVKHVSLTSGLPDTVYLYVNSYYNRTVYTYDSYNQPVLGVEANVYPGTTDTVAALDHYYYEPYYEEAVSSVNPVSESVKVYPNPAGDRIFVSLSNAQTGVISSVRIINIIGQTVANDQLDLSSGAGGMSVRDLCPGLYWVSVLDEKGNTVGREKFVKL